MLEQEDYGENGTIKITDYTKAFTIAKVVEETLELKPEAEEQHVILKEEKNIIDAPLGMTYETLNKLLNCSQTPKYHSITESSDVERTQSLNLVTDTSAPVATGDTVTVGTKIWTFSVRGDVDGDAQLTVNDIGVAKMHYIGVTALTGVYLEAIENDDLEGISVNDIGRLKLAFIKKIDDLYSDLVNEDE